MLDMCLSLMIITCENNPRIHLLTDLTASLLKTLQLSSIWVKQVFVDRTDMKELFANIHHGSAILSVFLTEMIDTISVFKQVRVFCF